MLSVKTATEIVTKETGKQPYSYSVLPYGIVFSMGKKSTEYYVVRKEDMKVYPYSPSLDLLTYSSSPKYLIKKGV